MFTGKNKFLSISVLFIILILLITNSRGLVSPLRVSVTDAVTPVFASFKRSFSGIAKVLPAGRLADENRRLRVRIDYLLRVIEELKIVRDENNRLRGSLDFKANLPFSVIAAEVIGRDPSNWSNSIVINKGSLDGLKQSGGVISAKGVVGRLVEVGRRSSKILLISDPASKIGVLVARNHQGGILIGRPNGSCKIIYIALDSDVKPGDSVITAGLGSVFPKGILVGQVVAVGKEPGRLYKYAIVKPASELSKLEEVYCIR